MRRSVAGIGSGRPARAVLIVLAVILAPLPAAAQPAPSANGLLRPEVRDAALWRAAALRLEVALGRRQETSRAQALAQAAAAWRASPQTASPAAEIDAVRPFVEAYMAPSLGAARWPSDEAPGVYPILAAEELRGARSDLDLARRSGGSPGPGLARVARVYSWAQGRTDGPTPFDDLDADIDAAFAPAVQGPDVRIAEAGPGAANVYIPGQLPAPGGTSPAPTAAPATGRGGGDMLLALTMLALQASGRGPAYGAPAYGNPAYGNPGYGGPTYGAPAYGTPAYGAPVYPGGYGAAPQGYAPGGLDARWYGMGADEVSPGAAVRPDGVADGQVYLQFPGERRYLKALDVYGLDAQGVRTSTHWSSWNASYWIVGVRSAGGPLNPGGHMATLGSAPQPLLLSMANDGSLTPGRLIEVEATYTDGSTAKGYLTVGQAGGPPAAAYGPPPPNYGAAPYYPPAAPAVGAPGDYGLPGGYGAPPAGAVQAAWGGMGSDEVSPGASGRPDGASDGQIYVQFPGEGRILRLLDIYALDDQGVRTNTHWSSWNSAYWVIGIRARALRLNPAGPVPNLGIPAQPLTLFVTDDGSLRPGRRFEVEAAFADGSTARGYFAIGP